MADPLPPARERSIPIDPAWQPITRGDVLFVLDALATWPDIPLTELGEASPAVQLFRASVEDLTDSLRKRWGIRG